MRQLKQEMSKLLQDNILSFWLNNMVDTVNGGFYGQFTGSNQRVDDAPKGAILNARILWTFSAAYRILKKNEYLQAATRAKNYIINHFLDQEYGGVYWCVDAEGRPQNTKKQIYAIAFVIYGLSEFARATNDPDAKDQAIRLFHVIEQHAFDSKNNGYKEALTREWKPINDMRLSDKDENGSKTMNTHLHIIEAYTNLLRIWRSPELEEKTRNLLQIFISHIINPETSHLDLFFDDNWFGERNIESYGHDIEASWLLHETACVIGDLQLIKKIEPIVINIAKAADKGLCEDGSMIYEYWKNTGETDSQRQWWIQCECIIGHINLFQHFNDRQALQIAMKCWEYTKTHLVDTENGEWFWGCDKNGNIDRQNDKAGFWKCPYHNGRMCMEIMERNLIDEA